VRAAEGGGQFGIVEDGLAEVGQAAERPVGEEGRLGVQGAVGVAVGGGGAAGVHLAGFQDDDRAGAGVDVTAPVGDDLRAADADPDGELLVGVRGVDVPVGGGTSLLERSRELGGGR
jgi:hypothetical protein